MREKNNTRGRGKLRGGFQQQSTKILMLASVQWPYLSIRLRCGIFALGVLFCSGQIVIMIMTFIKYRNDWDIILDNICISLIAIFCLTKHITTLRNSDEMLKLLNRIRADWIVWAGEREVNILHESAEQGRKLANVYIVGCYSFLFVYLSQPIVLKIIDVVLHNGSKPGQFPVPIYIYYLDVQVYYSYITFYLAVIGFLLLTIGQSYDVMLFRYMQHCCGIFTALGHKIENIGANDKSKETRNTLYAAKHRNRKFEHLIFTCIVRHNDAIEYADLIEATYSWTLLATMLLRLAIVSITGLQVVMRMNEPHETVKFIGCGLCFTSYVYFESYYSELIRDCSTSLRCYIHNCQWYNMSLKTQKLLLMMTMRCNVPCQLTAGKIVNISVETFAVFLKTALSYLMVLRSV